MRNAYNQALTHEQDAQLAQLHERLMVAPLRTYNQPDLQVAHGPWYNHISGLRLPLRSGECRLDITSHKTAEQDRPYGIPDYASMTWGEPNVNALKLVTEKDPNSGEVKEHAVIERKRTDGLVERTEINDQLFVAAIREYAFAALDALQQLEVPSES